MSSIIDIHPHIVSPDTKKYPLGSAGRHAIDLVDRTADDL